jgi:hypothetical protein
MIYIIRFQNGKSIARIMHEASVSKYRWKEMVYRKVYYAIVAVVWCIGVWLALNNGPVLDVMDDYW